MSNQNKGDEARVAFTKHCQDLNMSSPSRGRREGFLSGFDAGQRAKALEIAGELRDHLEEVQKRNQGKAQILYFLGVYIEQLEKNENG